MEKMQPRLTLQASTCILTCSQATSRDHLARIFDSVLNKDYLLLARHLALGRSVSSKSTT
jgi:hypothetical protein